MGYWMYLMFSIFFGWVKVQYNPGTRGGETAMTEEERFKIISNDYMDLIIRYNNNPSVFKRYTNASIHIMNDLYAVLYIPSSQLTGRTIRQYGYFPLPACYGLTTQKSEEASGIQRLRRLPNFNLRGQGVITGIIDTGIQYTNPVFLNKDGTSRIAAIWDQTINSENFPKPYFYGTQ
jgi:hypothetical protein